MDDNIEKHLVNLKQFKIFKKYEHNRCQFRFIKNDKGEKYVAKYNTDTLDPDREKLFLRELKILLSFQHSTIIKLLGFSLIDMEGRNNLTVITKYMEKGSISDLLKQKTLSKLTSTQLQIILIGISFGMMILHKQNVIHRDLKSENVFLDENYHPCIADFDLSKFYDPENSYQQSNRYGTTMYMAPEVILGNDYDTKADVYSFGIMMFEIITGIPIQDELMKNKNLNGYGLAMKIVLDDLKPVIDSYTRERYSGLTNIFDHCLLREKDQRPTFREIFKKLSLLHDDYFKKYEDKFPFIAINDQNTLDYDDDYIYCFENVDKDEVKSYVDSLLLELKPDHFDEIDKKFSKTREICKLIFEVNMSKRDSISSDYSDELHKYLSNLNTFFPTKNEIEIISNGLKHESLKLVFDSFQFPIIYENLNKMMENNDLLKTNESFEILSFYAFYTWVLISTGLINDDKNNFPLILKILHQITKATENVPEKEKYHNIASLCFSDTIFIAIEKNVVDDIDSLIHQILMFLSENKNIPDDAISNLCDSILKLIKNNSIDKRKLFPNFLKILDEVISSNGSLANYFQSILNNICYDLVDINVTSNDEADDLVLTLIDVWFKIYRNGKSDSILTLESVISHFFPNLTHVKIIQKMINVIIGNEISDYNQNHEIQNPYVICSLLKLFLMTDQIENILKYITLLLENSYKNCIKCFNCELDLLIIKILTKVRKKISKLKPKIETIEPEENIVCFDNKCDAFIEKVEEKFVIREDIIEQLLHIFELIALNASSVIVVQNFFSLLCPFYIDDKKCFSLIHKSIIRSLNRILNSAKFYPSAAIPLSSNEIKISNILDKSLNNGFSFVFWILMTSTSSTEYQINILTLELEKKNMSIVIKNDSLCLLSNSNANKPCVFQIKIPQNIWTMLTVTVNYNELNATLYMNKNKVAVCDFDDQLLSHKNLFRKYLYAHCTINQNNTCKNEDEMNVLFFLGNFMLSKPLSENEIAILAARGQKSNFIFSLKEEIIFAYIPQYKNYYLDSISLSSIHKIDGITEKYQLEFPRIETFYDIIIKECKLDIIIPLFQQSDIQSSDGSNDQLMNQFCIEILANLFGINERIQKLFYESNYFYVISNFIQYSNSSNITFLLYMLYFNLINVMTYENLQIQLIDLILLNFNLWSNSEIEERKKIFKHWYRFLYVQYDYLITPIKSMEWLLFNILKENHPKCQKYLSSIAVKFYGLKSPHDFIMLLVTFITQQTSLIKKKVLLNLFSSFIKLINFEIFDLSIIFDSIICILKSRIEDDEKIFFNVISELISFKKYSKYSLLIPPYIQLIISEININENKFSKDAFLKLISLMNEKGAIEIFPILCVITISEGNDYLNELLTKIQKNMDFYINNQLLLYPALLILKYSNCNDFYNKVIEVNATLFEPYLTNFICAINAIGSLGIDPVIFQQIKHDYLLHVLNEKKYQQKDSLFLVQSVCEFIFFRPGKEITLDQAELPLGNFDGNLKKFGLFLLNGLKEPPKYEKTIGLRTLTRKEKWFDLDLAKNVFCIYREQRFSNFKDTMSLLMALINKYDPLFVKKEKAKLPPSLNLIQLKESSIDDRLKMEKVNVLYNVLNEQNCQFVQTIYTHLKTINLEDLVDEYKKLQLNFKKQEDELSEKRHHLYCNLWHKLTVPRHVWSQLNMKYLKAVITRNKFFHLCLYPSKVHLKTPYLAKEKQKPPSISFDKNIQLFECKLIDVKSEKNALFHFDDHSISITTTSDNKTRTVETNNMKNIWNLRNNSTFIFQIVTYSYESFLLTFHESQFAKIMKSISSIIKCGDIIKSSDSKIYSSWINGNLNNFNYLLRLNMFSGRSFNDLQHYPVFPWIICDYDSPNLNLSSPSSYRNLSEEIPCDATDDKYVLSWLSRIEPFKSILRKRPDCDTVKFNSIKDSFYEKSRELIPEFFFLPEIFINEEIGNVNLPQWSNQSAYEFVYIQRKALESSYVTNHLNEWIDLVFGCKMNSQCHTKLFKSEHPQKKFVPNKTIPFLKENDFITIKFKGINKYILSMVYLNSNDDSLCFKCIEKIRGQILSYSVKISDLKSSEITCQTLKSTTIKKEVFEGQKNVHMQSFFGYDHILLTTDNSKCIKIINCYDGSLEMNIRQKSKIVSVLGIKDEFLIVSTHDTTVSLYKIDLSKTSFNDKLVSFSKMFIDIPAETIYSSSCLKKLYSFKSDVSCIAFKISFCLMVCGTSDCNLLFCDTRKEKFLIREVVKIDGKPYSLCITSNFGFVVALLKKIENGKPANEIALFSLNGDKIRSVKKEIIAITEAESQPGQFDYLIVADNENQIFVLEAFYLQFKNPVYKCNSGICKLKYITEKSLIIAFCVDGTVSIIYHPIIDDF